MFFDKVVWNCSDIEQLMGNRDTPGYWSETSASMNSSWGTLLMISVCWGKGSALQAVNQREELTGWSEQWVWKNCPFLPKHQDCNCIKIRTWPCLTSNICLSKHIFLRTCQNRGRRLATSLIFQISYLGKPQVSLQGMLIITIWFLVYFLMYISALIHSDWTCCYVHLSVIQPAPKHLEPISCLRGAFLNTVVPGSTGIYRYKCCKMSFWSINMIAGVPVKCTSNNSLKSIFVDKFIDFFENWKYALLCHVGGVWYNLI